MTELPAGGRTPVETPNALSSARSRISPDRNSLRRRRRRIRSAAFTGGEGNRRRTPTTPLLQWKFNETVDLSGENVLKDREAVGEARPAFSARRLAAGIWQLRLPEGGGGRRMNQGLERHLPYSSHGNGINLYPDDNYESSSPLAIKNRKGGIAHKCISQLDTSASLLHFSKERATKWDSECPNVLKDAYDLYGSMKLLEDQQSDMISIVSFLQSELEQARLRVSELEAEQQSAKKKLGHFVRKIEDQKVAWKRKEHEKIRSVIDSMKEDLSRERKNRQRLEIMNAKLVNELTKTKLSANQFLQEFEKESKTRELLEEVCNELAKEIGDDKAEVEALKIESLKTREEVEEERKMLQMAEVWREERVQMKLIDAKLTLEEKYSQLSALQEEIETFLKSRSGNNFDVSEMKQAEALKKTVGSIKPHDIKQLSYQPPPASEDIYSIFEELQPREQVCEREIEQCNGSVTLEPNGLLEKPINGCNSLMLDGNVDEEDDSGWETVSHVEEQDSSKSPNGSEPSVNGVYLESQASISGTDWDELGDDEKQNGEINEVFSVTTKQSRKKGSSISRLWKSSRANNGEDLKRISFELTSGRLCNGRLSNATVSPARKSGETGLSSSSVGNWSSPDLLKSNNTEGMKGRLDWPWASKKQSLKAKLLEARIRSQKLQLRQVLKQKM
ncbi:uncharacterized protein LOC110093650 isoform X1 [Dendrobium catenatum]|uniref:uncharacterized protein LOC110093650 isoform X1 n=1 Tax=Dendrobium catenatum TaxID=906689 RepID=UPI0009F37A11|nr:uncharacterized protein LOC110093650 isoform X1 [Dendrobium catenatum]